MSRPKIYLLCICYDRNGSVVVDYRVNFKTEVGDKYAVVIECYLSDRERKRLDTLSVDYEIPKEIG